MSCAPSRAYVVYQANCEEELPVELACPAGRVTAERFPFGKLVQRRDNDTAILDVDAAFKPCFGFAWQLQRVGAMSSDLMIETDTPKLTAILNGDAREPHREVLDGKAVWVVKPYDVNNKVPPIEYMGLRPVAPPVSP